MTEDEHFEIELNKLSKHIENIKISEKKYENEFEIDMSENVTNEDNEELKMMSEVKRLRNDNFLLKVRLKSVGEVKEHKMPNFNFIEESVQQSEDKVRKLKLKVSEQQGSIETLEVSLKRTEIKSAEYAEQVQELKVRLNSELKKSHALVGEFHDCDIERGRLSILKGTLVKQSNFLKSDMKSLSNTNHELTHENEDLKREMQSIKSY